MPGTDEVMSVYEKAGIAGLFLLLFTVAIGLLIKELMRARRQDQETTKLVISALDKSVTAIDRNTVALERHDDAITENSKTMSELLAYFEGRDGRARR